MFSNHHQSEKINAHPDTTPKRQDYYVQLPPSTELKSPLLIVISQPLHYKIIESEAALATQTPVTGEELAALVDNIPVATPLIIVFGGGQNKYRYELINSISLRPEGRTNILNEEAIILQSKKDGERWKTENNHLFKQWKAEGRKVYVYCSSELMYKPDCLALYKDMTNDYNNPKDNAKKKALKEDFTNFIKVAVLSLYSPLLAHANSGGKFYSADIKKQGNELDIKEVLFLYTLQYVIHEFALTVKLAENIAKINPASRSSYMLYKKKTPKKENVKGQFAQQADFGQFAPKLLRKTLELYARDEVHLLYREYLTSLQMIITEKMLESKKNSPSKKVQYEYPKPSMPSVHFYDESLLTATPLPLRKNSDSDYISSGDDKTPPLEDFRFWSASQVKVLYVVAEADLPLAQRREIVACLAKKPESPPQQGRLIPMSSKKSKPNLIHSTSSPMSIYQAPSFFNQQKEPKKPTKNTSSSSFYMPSTLRKRNNQVWRAKKDQESLNLSHSF